MTASQQHECPFIKVGEDTTGDILWCEKCGTICDGNGEKQFPLELDFTIYCVEEDKL